MVSNRLSFRRIKYNLKPSVRVPKTDWPPCGHLTGSYVKLLEAIEKLHICPESLAFAYPDQGRAFRSNGLSR
jgi:hypothetical protein